MRHSAIEQILIKQDITTWYQPLIDMNRNKIFGWGALTRGPSVSTLHSANALFDAADKARKLKPLDLLCVQNATKCFEQLLLAGKLFVNISLETFLAGNILRKQLSELVEKGPLEPSKIVLELSERGNLENIDQLDEAIRFFHDLGFQIAVDNMGMSHMSIDQWLLLKPDYVKIDRHLVNGVDEDFEKQKFVRSIVVAARSTRAKILAEGVETLAELKTLRSLGVNLCQGYLFQRPELAPLSPDLSRFSSEFEAIGPAELVLACDMVSSQVFVSSDSTCEALMRLFDNNASLASVAVLRNEAPVGLVQRHRFMQDYPMLADPADLEVRSVMDSKVLVFDGHMRLVDFSRKLAKRSRSQIFDDFVVCDEGKFLGLGQVADVFKALSALT